MPSATNPLQLEVRDKVELHVPAGESVAIFTVRVQEILDNGIVIDRPIIEQRLMPAPPGKSVDIYFQRQDATYRFASKIISETVLDRLPVLLIQKPREIERIQRREHFRLDIDLPLRFRLLRGAGGEVLSPYLIGKVVNLSAGGVKFSAEMPDDLTVIANDVLQLAFTMTKSFSVAGIEALILKATSDQRLANRQTFICRFLNIPADIQEAIIVQNIRYQQRYRVEARGR